MAFWMGIRGRGTFLAGGNFNRFNRPFAEGPTPSRPYSQPSMSPVKANIGLRFSSDISISLRHPWRVLTGKDRHTGRVRPAEILGLSLILKGFH